MNWDCAESWYDACVGEKGHYYHRELVIPGALRLLALKKGDSLLDIGCGQGVFFRHLPKEVGYLGIDSSKALLKKAGPPEHFLHADATEKLPLEKRDFSAASFILSLQNIEFPEKALANAAAHLKVKGRLLLVMNHPCFRIPRQSHWGIDEGSKIQYRRMNVYMTPQKIPLQVHPGKGDLSPETHTYHSPLSSYVAWLAKERFAIKALEEWCSNKKSEGARAKMEDRARREFPLFLALLAEKF